MLSKFICLLTVQLYWEVLFWNTLNASHCLGCRKLSFRKYCVMHGGQIVLDDSVNIKRLYTCDLLHLWFFHHWRQVSKCLNPLLPLLRDRSIFVSTPCFFFILYDMILKVFYWDALKSIFWWVAHPGGSITGSVEMSTRDTWSV